MSDSSIGSWLELESDPGLFTLLLNDFGIDDVQVEEIYDLTKPFDSNVYGFLFLFKWTERRTRRRGGCGGGLSASYNGAIASSSSNEAASNYVTDSNIVNKMFFARQLAHNSCATHALLSILMNCHESLFDLGEYLNQFKATCSGLTAEQKGQIIGSERRLFEAHNSYAKPEPIKKSDRSQSSTVSQHHVTALSTNNAELFHYICFVPINDRLYELDGLQPYPIDHGPVHGDWTDKFKQVIQERINLNKNQTNGSSAGNGSLYHASGQTVTSSSSYCNFNSAANNEIRYNLMALVPDRIRSYENYLRILCQNKVKLLSVLEGKEHLLTVIKTEDVDNEATSTRQLRNRTISSTNLEQFVNYKIKLSGVESTHVNKSLLTAKGHDEVLIEFEDIIQVNDDSDGDFQFSLRDLVDLEKRLEADVIPQYELKLKEELDKRKRYRVDALRRKHKYDDFILTYICMLIENNKLSKIMQEYLDTLKSEKGSFAKKIKKK